MPVICHIQNQMHRDYLHSLFAFENDAFSVFRDTKVGKFICSMVRTAEYPVEQKIDNDKAVHFRLPRTSAIPSLFTQFNYITPDDQRKINDYLIAIFDADYMQYYLVGIQAGLMQKTVIENFILSRKLVSRIGEVEQLKKRSYRSEEKGMKQIVKRLARRVQIQNAEIRKTIEAIQQYQY